MTYYLSSIYHFLLSDTYSYFFLVRDSTLLSIVIILYDYHLSFIYLFLIIFIQVIIICCLHLDILLWHRDCYKDFWSSSSECTNNMDHGDYVSESRIFLTPLTLSYDVLRILGFEDD